LLVKSNDSYIYQGQRNISDLIHFAKEGYLNTTAIKITGPKTTFERILAAVGNMFEGFAMLMDSLGLSFLPYTLKAAIPILVLLSPIIGIILCLIFIPDTTAEPINQEAKKEEKSEKPEKKQEKEEKVVDTKKKAE
jgi:hypothetical protein